MACSIRRNICYGLEAEDGVPADEVPTTADVEEAARLANAHDFIMGLPEGYDTVSLILTLPCIRCRVWHVLACNHTYAGSATRFMPIASLSSMA